MKSKSFSAITASISVLIFVLLLSACTTDRSFTKNDFYNKRIINKTESRDFAFRLPHHNSHAISKNKSVPADNNLMAAGTVNVVSLLNPALSLKPISTDRVDLASVSNKLFVDPAHERLSKKISNLYTSGSDIKTFQKGYKEIKKQRISEFKKIKKADDSIGIQQPKDDRPGLSIISFVLGIVGLLVFGIVCGILAVILGGIGMKRGLKGLAIAGIVLGIIDIVGALIVISAM